MQARRTLTPGQKNTNKFLERYGEQLFYIHYCYDEQPRKRGATVEIIVEESSWSPSEKPETIGLRVEFQGTELQRRVKQAGGKWNSAKLVERPGSLPPPLYSSEAIESISFRVKNE